MKAFIPAEPFLSPQSNNLFSSVLLRSTVHFPQSCLNWGFFDKMCRSAQCTKTDLQPVVVGNAKQRSSSERVLGFGRRWPCAEGRELRCATLQLAAWHVKSHLFPFVLTNWAAARCLCGPPPACRSSFHLPEFRVRSTGSQYLCFPLVKWKLLDLRAAAVMLHYPCCSTAWLCRRKAATSSSLGTWGCHGLLYR